MREENFANLMLLRDEITELMSRIQKHLAGEEGFQELEPINYHKHLGRGIYCSINDEYKKLDIRHYFLPLDSTTPTATTRGISLNCKQWETFLTLIPKIKKGSEAFANARPNACFGLHGNQEDECSFCDPFGIECGLKIPKFNVVTSNWYDALIKWGLNINYLLL